MRSKQKYNVAIIGATGAVGEEMLKILEQRDFPVGQLKLLASARSAGKKYNFKGRETTVEELKEDSFSASSGKGIDIVLASAGGLISKKFAPLAVKEGAIVIDNTSAFRMDPEVPLVIPEINPKVLSPIPIVRRSSCWCPSTRSTRLLGSSGYWFPLISRRRARAPRR